MTNKLAMSVAASAVAAIAGGASAQSANVNLSGLESRDEQGNAINVVLLVPLVPNAEVIGIDWNLFFTPNSPSWTSEPHLTFGDSAGSNAYDWDMGGFGGVNNSTPIALAGNVGTSFFVGGDGLLRIELWEDFVDFAGAADGIYSNSGLVIWYVPAPSSLALLGLGGLVAMRRRR